jgi:hypothetical protein
MSSKLQSMKKIFLSVLLIAASYCSYAQSQIITTGNNVVDPANPIAADVVIGSNSTGGTRHDASMMWWSNGSASRISNTADVFYLSVWSTATPNIALAATVGGTSYFQGNLSIGTTDSKGYKFAVNGSAIATSMTVKLNANWPDYVFKKDYQLPSLTEVKTYIDQNHHLPEMPSEQEVIKDGLNLGEMNKLLTKKVEELTLYLIELKTEKKEQEERIDRLEDSMKELLKSK